jgi:transcriptional regulator with XRE-family HTH domain
MTYTLTPKNLRTQRRIAGVSLGLLSRVANIEASRLSRLERRERQPHPGELEHIASALDSIAERRVRLTQIAEREGVALEEIGLVL